MRKVLFVSFAIVFSFLLFSIYGIVFPCSDNNDVERLKNVENLMDSRFSDYLRQCQDAIERGHELILKAEEKAGVNNLGGMIIYIPDMEWFGETTLANFTNYYEASIKSTNEIIDVLQKNKEVLLEKQRESASWKFDDYSPGLSSLVEHFKLQISIMDEKIEHSSGHFMLYSEEIKDILQNDLDSIIGVLSEIDIISCNEVVVEDGSIAGLLFVAVLLSIALYWFMRQRGCFYALFFSLSAVWICFVVMTIKHVYSIALPYSFNLMIAPSVAVFGGSFFAKLICPPYEEIKSSVLNFRKVRYVKTRMTRILVYLVMVFAGVILLYVFLYFLPKVFFPVVFCAIILISYFSVIDDLEDYIGFVTIIGLGLIVLCIIFGIKLGNVVSPFLHSNNSNIILFLIAFCYISSIVIESVTRNKQTLLYSGIPARYYCVEMKV